MSNMEETKRLDIKTLRCLVVDDEPIAREGMVDLIESVDFLKVEGICASAMEAVAFLQSSTVDLLFLDVNMPYLSGLDMLESLEHQPLTILTTAYSEYAVEGFRLQVADYLLKPITFKRFYQAVLRAQQLCNVKGDDIEKTKYIPNYLYVRQNSGFFKIEWKDIQYIESMENYIKIITKNTSLIAHQTMQSIEDLLPSESFFRIHRSFLVNLHHIDSISGRRVIIKDYQLPLSRNRKEELMQSVVYKNLIGK